MTSRLFFKNVVGNMLMFLPFGFFISYYLKNFKPYLTILLTVIASVSIEIVQLSIGRVFDVDDIILNVMGGFIGYFGYYILIRIGEKTPKVFKSEWFLNIISVIILIGIILFIIIATSSFYLYNLYEKSNPKLTPGVKELIDEKKKSNYSKKEEPIITNNYINQLPEFRSQYNNPYIMGKLEIPNLNINTLVTRYTDNSFYLDIRNFKKFLCFLTQFIFIITNFYTFSNSDIRNTCFSDN